MKSLSVAANVALKMAASEAVTSKHPYIEKEHLLIGITSLEKIMMFGQKEWGLSQQDRQRLQSEHDALEKILREFQFNTAKMRRMVHATLVKGNYKHTDRVIHRSEACKSIFNRAEKLVELTPEVSCLHLFAALLEEPGEEISNILRKAELDPAVLRDHALVLAGERQESDKDTVKSHEDINETIKKGTHYLDRYGRDLTKEAREGRLGPFAGRRKELLQIIQTLARSTKNNPVLVGEAGVGKTAIVEALAIRVAQGKDPNILKNKRIIELNMGTLLKNDSQKLLRRPGRIRK
jgi:ATP-dependent Clp protease ATP-binding subunit ClpC